MNETKENSSLPEGWKWVKLGDVCTKMSNGANAKQSDEKIGLAISRIETIWNETIDWNRVKYIQENEKEFIEKYALKENDILFSHINSDIHLGKTAIYKNQNQILIHGINLLLIRLNEDAVADFFNYQFKYKRKIGEFSSIAQKSVNQSSINQPKLKNVDFALPPKPIQQAIVYKIEELFSELDKSIETLRLAQQQLKTYRQAVFQWAFEGKLTEEWREENGTTVRLPAAPQESYVASLGIEPELMAAETLADYQVAKNNDELPEGWEWVELSKVCEVKRGKSKHRPRNEPTLYGGPYPFIQTGDVRSFSGRYITEYSQTYSELGLQQSKLWPKGTLCITIAANIGETAILGFDACFPDSVVGLLCNEEKLLNIFTNYFFVSFKHKLEELAPATAQKNINVDILARVRLPLPPIKEQYEVVNLIENRFSVADKMEESIIQSLQQAEALRQSILKKAFEGKLIIEKKPAIYKPKSEYFYQVQLLGLIARASKKKDIVHGEMTIAKYAYLVDKIYGVPTYYDYKRWHLGPYPPEMKKAVSNKTFFKKQNGNLEVADEEVLFKYNNHYQKEIENAVDDLAVIFSKYSTKERAHKTELLATVCKVVEDIQTLDLQAVRASMKEWKIELENSPFKNKAEKFTEPETEKCLTFLVEKAWDRKLVTM